MSLYHHLCENDHLEIQIFGKQNPDFFEPRHFIDACVKDLTTEGIGSGTKSADPIVQA